MPRLLVTTTLRPEALQQAMDRVGIKMQEVAPARPLRDARLVDADFTSLQDGATPHGVRMTVVGIDGIQQALPVPDAQPGLPLREN